MIGSGLPARVGDGAWREWLARFPSIPGASQTALLIYRKRMIRHLADMPSVTLLSPAEARHVGDDLIHYCRDLHAVQRASSENGLLNLAVAGAGLTGAILFPAAAVPLAVLAFCAAGLGMARTYEMNRRQQIVDETIELLSQLSWRLKH